MCGIAGLYSPSLSIDYSTLHPMLKTLSHRGPDGQGVDGYGPVLFGHRRLSIIDIACGTQPMWGSRHQALVTFNGEIFNYRELRDELEREGVVFRTRSDTEVLVNAYEQWGERAFTRFNGQFAFGLYDTSTSTLYLVRDRMGEKPLYYHKSPDVTAFASEVKALAAYLKDTNKQCAIDPDRLSLYLSFNYLPLGGSLLEGVESLPPGHFARVTQNSFSLHRYWYREPRPTNIEELDAALKLSTKLRLRSDVPMGIFLSGGIDSTLIASYMAEDGGTPAFSAHFKEAGFSEALYAKETCDVLGFAHHVVDIAPDPSHIPTLIRRLAHHGDAPLGDSSALPVFLLSEATSQRVTVVLAGDGGDELFGGYLTYKASMIAGRIPRFLRNIAGYFPPYFGRYDTKVGTREKLERFIRALPLPSGADHLAWNAAIRGNDLTAVLQYPPQCSPFKVVADHLVLSSFAYPDLLRADQESYLPYDILAKTDTMSMAHGLEVRAPFLDHNVVEIADGLPVPLRRGKEALKVLLRERCPWYPLNRPKRGFSIPIHTWFRGPLRELFEDELSGLHDCSLLRPEGIRVLWQDHLRGWRNMGFELWGILILILWAEEMGVEL